MKRMIVIVTVLSWMGLGNMVSAKELLPWQTENILISAPGSYFVTIDDRKIFFEVPEEQVTKVGRAKEVITKGEEYEKWLKENGEYEKGCFGMSWDFYPLGIPLFGISAQFSISAKLHVKNSPARRDSPTLHALVPDYLSWNADRGDFSKPEELFENLKRTTLIPGHSTPVEEMIINARKWYRYYWNTSGYPDDLREVYVTGLAPDRYLEITIRQYPVPVTATRYPTYPTEDQRPGWMKKTHKYKEQVINSLRITQPEGSKEPDLYDVETLTPAPTERPIPQP
jgi:hypothetical protein